MNTHLERQPLLRRDEPGEGMQSERCRWGTVLDVQVATSPCCTEARLVELEARSDTCRPHSVCSQHQCKKNQNFGYSSAQAKRQISQTVTRKLRKFFSCLFFSYTGRPTPRPPGQGTVDADRIVYFIYCSLLRLPASYTACYACSCYP